MLQFLNNDESACLITLPVLCLVLAAPARSYRHCNALGFYAGALGNRAKLRGLRISLECTANYQSIRIIHFGISYKPGFDFFASIILFKLLFKDSSESSAHLTARQDRSASQHSQR